MKKTGICPKCNHDKIIIIQDQLHENGGGNISQITNHINNPSQVFAIFKEGNTAKKTFYICENYGYKFVAKNPHACVWDESHISLDIYLEKNI